MASIKGDIGEVITAHALRSQCGMNVIRNMYLPYNNHFTEIDMIGVCDKGIFVIENKNYEGKIIGHSSEKYWKVLYPNNCYSVLYNPLQQNESHITILLNYLRDFSENLKEFIGVDPTSFNPESIFNVVIFNDKGFLSIYDDRVFTLSSFMSWFENLRPNILDSNSVSDIISICRLFSNQSDEMKKIHRDLLRRNVKC